MLGRVGLNIKGTKQCQVSLEPNSKQHNMPFAKILNNGTCHQCQNLEEDRMKPFMLTVLVSSFSCLTSNDTENPCKLGQNRVKGNPLGHRRRGFSRKDDWPLALKKNREYTLIEVDGRPRCPAKSEAKRERLDWYHSNTTFTLSAKNKAE